MPPRLCRPPPSRSSPGRPCSSEAMRSAARSRRSECRCSRDFRTRPHGPRVTVEALRPWRQAVARRGDRDRPGGAAGPVRPRPRRSASGDPPDRDHSRLSRRLTTLRRNAPRPGSYDDRRVAWSRLRRRGDEIPERRRRTRTLPTPGSRRATLRSRGARAGPERAARSTGPRDRAARWNPQGAALGAGSGGAARVRDPLANPGRRVVPTDSSEPRAGRRVERER